MLQCKVHNPLCPGGLVHPPPSHTRYLDQLVNILIELRTLTFPLIGKFEADMSITPFDEELDAPPTPSNAFKPKGSCLVHCPHPVLSCAAR